MKSIYLLLLLLIAISCNSSSNSKNDALTGHWKASKITSSGKAVPEYLVGDFEINLAADNHYSGDLNFLELDNEGTYSLIQDPSRLIINSDTFEIKTLTKDTLALFYKSYTVPFDLVLLSDK